MADQETFTIIVKEEGAEKTKRAVSGVRSATDKTAASSKKLSGGLLGMSGGLKGVTMAAGAAGGALLALKAVQIIANLFKKAAKATIDFAKGLSKLGGMQEKGRATMIGLLDDVKKGTEAYDRFDEAVTMTALDKSIFDMKAYADAVGKGLGDAYLDAARAGTVMEVRQRTLMRALAKMDAGIKPTQDTLVDLKAVLDRVGISMEDINSGAISLTDTSILLKEGLKEVGDAQEEAASSTIIGKYNILKGIWTDIKEELGETINEGLKPFLDSLIEVIQKAWEAQDLQIAFKVLADSLKDNKDLLIDVANVLPAIFTAASDVVMVMGTWVDELGEANRSMDGFEGDSLSGIERITKSLEDMSIPVVAFIEWLKAIAPLFEGVEKAGVSQIKIIGRLALETAKAAAGVETQTITWDEATKKAEGLVEGVRKARVEAKGLREDEKKADEAFWEKADPFWTEEDEKEKVDKTPTGLGVDDEKIAEESQKLIDSWTAYLEARKVLSDRAAEEEAEKLKVEYDEAMDAFNEAYDEAIEKMEKDKQFNKTVGASIAGDIRAAILDGADVSDIFADRLANAVEAALADAISRAMLKLGVSQALSQIPIVGPFLSALLGVGHEGLYTKQEGTYLLSKGEGVFTPQATEDIVNMVNKGLLNPNINMAAPGGEAGVSINVDSKASDLVDIYRAESVDKGSTELDHLRGESF